MEATHARNEATAKVIGTLNNQIELLNEEIESVHMFLDDKGVPRTTVSYEDGYKGEERRLSIVGRIKHLIGVLNVES